MYALRDTLCQMQALASNITNNEIHVLVLSATIINIFIILFVHMVHTYIHTEI